MLDLNGAAIPHARVQLGSERGTPNEQGSVTFPDRTPTTIVDLGAGAEGYVTNTLSDWEIPEGTVTEVLVLDWESTPVVIHVVDADSRQPIAANVRWDGPGHIPTERTDPETGQVVFQARPGTWRLQAQTDHYHMNQRSIEVVRTDNPAQRFALVPNWMQIESLWVPFEPTSAELSQQQTEALDALAADLFGFPDTAISIEGHADDTEDHLSLTRASAVRDALVASGISASQLTIRDLMATTPVQSPWTAEGRVANRSVRLTWTEEDDTTLEVRIPFETDSSTLPTDLAERIGPVVQAAATGTVQIDILGHRDRSEGALSQQRADAVRDHLLYRDVTEDRLFAMGRRAVEDLDSGVGFRLRSGGETVELPHQIFFEPGTEQVEAVSVQPLRQAAALAKSHPVMRIAIRGYAVNEDLSAAGELASSRAEVVARFFRNNGVDADRITKRGFPEVGVEEAVDTRMVDFVVLPPPLLSSERIRYDAGVDAPDNVAEPVLRRVAEAMAMHPVRVEISGTGVEADQAPGSVLGRLRASKVQDALIALGVERVRLSTSGSASTAEEGAVTFRVSSVSAAEAVGFHARSSELDANSRGKLLALVPSLLLTHMPVEVTGSASGADGRVILADLAEERAAAVAEFLEYAGIDAQRLRTRIVVNETGGPADRRVEVRLGNP
ncbi:MAG: outer membrane protein OmpA-like peptidoglycan-associated protein [Myxococcota bacterium]